MPELVQFPIKNLSDIPGKLRQLADQIEQGEFGEIPSALVLLPQAGDWPRAFGFGDVDGDFAPITVLTLALRWFTDNIVRRR